MSDSTGWPKRSACRPSWQTSTVAPGISARAWSATKVSDTWLKLGATTASMALPPSRAPAPAHPWPPAIARKVWFPAISSS